MTSGKTKEFLKSPGRPGPKILDPKKSLGSFLFRVPKSEDHFTGHRFEISSNGFLLVIGNRLERALKVFSGGTDQLDLIKIQKEKIGSTPLDTNSKAKYWINLS